jgi:hypothetical protein
MYFLPPILYTSSLIVFFFRFIYHFYNINKKTKILPPIIAFKYLYIFPDLFIK